MNDVHAIIPVAGVGSRLRPHTYSAPKVLVQVAGKPILGHILDELQDLGIERLTLIVGYLGDMIRDYVDSSYSFKTEYVHQEELRGLGHAIYTTRESAKEDKRLLIILGDTIFKCDLRSVLSSKDSLIGVKEVTDPKRFGIIELEGDRILGMQEKPDVPKTNLGIVGIYYLNNPALLFKCLGELIESGQTTKGEFQLTDALQRMMDLGEKFTPFFVDGWYDCGKPDTLLLANREILAREHPGDSNHNPSFPNSIITPPVSIAPTAQVDSSIIGPYVTVADGAIIRNSVIHDSIISRKAMVSNIFLERSIISDNAKVESKPYRLNVGDSSELSLG